MEVSLIAAMGRDCVIGLDNKLPWRLPADMSHFRALTMGKPVLMGRKTHQSIGQPLTGRTNLVLSRDPEFSSEGCRVVSSLEAALAECRTAAEVMVIGGADCYAQALPHARRLYLTYIDHVFEGDQYFPSFDENEWGEVDREEHEPDAKNAYRYTFATLERRDGSAL